MDFIGRVGNDVLFMSNDTGVIVDESSNTVSKVDDAKALVASAFWDKNGSQPLPSSVELANAAVSHLDIEVFADNDRMYTIPKSVQAEAKRGLEWRKEENRGGTPVGLNTARTLAAGGQIGIKKLRHIAKYFPRHEVDKKGKGYKPAEDGYPSNGRIAWALWGGDSAWRWASTIVERENEKSASNFDIYEEVPSVNLESFVASGFSEDDDEFFVRIFADGSGFDRLYKRDKNNVLSVWDDASWSDLAGSFSKFSEIDSRLDTFSSSLYFHSPVDSDAAFFASAYLDGRQGRVLVSEVNKEEASLVASALGEIDWEMIETITAAGTDEGFTPEERAAEVKNQPRDAMGQFAKKGGRVSVGSAGGATGVIQSIDNGNAVVKMDSGGDMTVPVGDTQAADSVAAPPKRYSGSPLDLTGILGEPRAAGSAPNAKLPAGSLPPLTSDDLQALLNDWPSWVADQRSKFSPREVPQIPVNTDAQDHKAPNAFNDPYLRKWLDKKATGNNNKTSYPNRTWYNPVRTDDVDKKKKKSDVYSILASAQGSPVSDVPPVYMAVVAPDDPLAVMDLVCLVPASQESTEPMVYAFKDGKWSPDSGMLRDLKSPTPPPVVVLDNEALGSVLTQMTKSEDSNKKPAEPAAPAQPAPVTASIDESLAALWTASTALLPVTAAGGADRNRGNAEELRRYWTVGKGGLKIRWGTKGDWTRCVRQLSKYLGPRAKGYCALRHKEMTGLWTGDKAHRQMYGRKGKGVFAMSDEMILSSSEVIEKTVLRARSNEVKNRVLVASGGFNAPAKSLSHGGSPFYMPLVVPEGIETGDGRKFSKGSITMRDLPLPLMWQIKTDEGHYGSVIVGRIDSMERVADGIGNAYGVFDTGEYGREAERLVRGGFIRGISADLDKFEADDDPEDASNKEKKGQGKILISKARVMGVTLVPKPAFQECTIQLVKEPQTMDYTEQDALVACASVIASIPVVPPRDWFRDPKLSGPTPLTVTDDGRVFGHIAAWHVDHIGLSMGTKPPRSKSNYSYFQTGVIRTNDGTDVPVGQLTLAGGHASLNADARAAAKHYDDTGSACADVSAGEDSYGIWVAGALRPEVTPQQVRALRASAPSGDWRPIQGNLELVAVCQVNVPGFPVARARVASGQMYALVAAGASYLAQLKDNPELVLQAAEDAKTRFAAIKSAFEGSESLTAGGLVEPVYMESMKGLLADLVGFYFRAHGYHWNVTGEDFAQYHALFGEIYSDVYGSIDPLAENVRKLGGFPDVSLKDYAEKSSLAGSELTGGSPKALAADLLIANEMLVEELKDVFSMMDASNEQGVADFIAGRIDAHQKWSWQLASSLSPEDMIIAENDNRSVVFEAVFSSLESEGLVASPEIYGDFAYISEKVRKGAAEKGFALPDGSYPIRNIADLKNAIQAYGRSKPSKRAKVRAHIIKRAKDLKRPDLIPDTFKDTASIEAAEFSAMRQELASRVHGASWADKASALSARVHGLTAAAPVMPEAVEDVPLVDEVEAPNSGYEAKYTPKTQPRDAQGKFRQVLARLKQDLGAASLDKVAQKVAEVENLDNTGDYSRAVQGAHEVIDVVDRIDSGALDKTSLANVRMGATALAEAISNLPLPFKDQSQKIRFSDVPPALQKLLEDMMDKVVNKIGADDAKIATEKLDAFKSGSEVLSQGEISSELNKLLRLLT